MESKLDFYEVKIYDGETSPQQGILNGDWRLIENFTARELACPESMTVELSKDFLTNLDLLRFSWGEPLTVTSCCRSDYHNNQIGGHPRSLHLMRNPFWLSAQGTIALDVTETSDDFRELAWILGWSIGYGETFTHLDRRVDIGLDQTKFYY